MGLHAQYAPSSGSKWINCDLYIFLYSLITGKYGKEDSSPAAEEGTLAHEKVAEILQARNPTRALRNSDISLEDKINFEYYIDMVESYLDEFTKKGLNPELFVEWGVEANERLFGTADCVIVHDKGIVIIDYKHGKRVYVDADSWQLRIYGYLALLQFAGTSSLSDIAFDSYGDDDEIQLVVVQPRYHEKNIERVRSVTHKYKTFGPMMENTINEAMAKSEEHESCNTGDHCTFCFVKPFCPGQKEVIVRTLAIGEDLGSESNLKFVLDNEKVIRDIVKKARAIATKGLEIGSIDPQKLGYGLKKSLGNRQWDHAGGEEKIAPLLRRHGVEKDVVWVRKLISPAQAEKLIDDKKWLEKYIAREDRGVSLVTLDKADPSLSGAAADALADFEVPAEETEETKFEDNGDENLSQMTF